VWPDIRRLAPALALLGLAMIPTSLTAQDDDPVIGNWRGALDVGGASLTIVFHLSQDDDGELGGTMDSPDQGGFGIPLSSVTSDGTDLALTVASIGGTFEGTLSDDRDAITGTWSQGANSLALDLTRITGDSPEYAPPARPQEPKAPFPYGIEEVTFVNAEADIELAGTVTMPSGDGPFPGVILVSGSGPQDRDETLMGHKPFWVLADHLSRAGIAVLRYDDRGVADSGGDFAAATSEDFASDALAAAVYLAGLAGVAHDRVGIVGHSEGGLVGPMAATRSDAVGFVVMLAGPGVPGLDILVEQGELINEAAGAPPEITAMNGRVQRALAQIVRDEPDADVAALLMRTAMEAEIDALPEDIKQAAGAQLSASVDQSIQQMNTPWFRFFLHHDPRPALEQLSVPVLAIVGEKDLQVPPKQSVPEIEAAFARGGNPDATVQVLPGLNHLFQEADTGAPSEYQRIEETFNAAALELVSSWILERFGRPAADGSR